MEYFVSQNEAILMPFGVSCLFGNGGYPTTLVNE